MKLPFRVAVVFAGTLLAAAVVSAQTYPSRPVRVVVGYPPGTSPDLIARISSAAMSKRLGQPFVIENRSGANGMFGPAAAAKAEPDGHTLTLGSLLNVHPIFLKNGPLVIGRDLATVGGVAATPWVLLVRGSLGVKTYKELVAYSRANPGKLNYGSVAAQIDLFSEVLRAKTGLDYTPIRYKGAPVTEIFSGEVDFYIGTITGLAAHITAGKMLPLLFTKKYEPYPNVPTSIELGVTSAPILSISGYYTTAGTPRDTIQKLAAAIEAATKSPEVIQGIQKLGLDISYTTPEEQGREYDAQIAFFTEAARLAKFEPQ